MVLLGVRIGSSDSSCVALYLREFMVHYRYWGPLGKYTGLLRIA